MPAQSRPTLILTRPAAANARFAAAVARCHGDRLALCQAPLLTPVFRDPAIAPEAGGQVIFTAETGVAALARLTDRRGRAICVGPRTAEAASAAGWQAEIWGGGDAEGLIAALAARRPPGRWLHARAREAVTDLAGRLNAAGMQVDEAIVYAQDALPPDPAVLALLAGATPVILAAFSPRSARLLVPMARDARAPLSAIAISAAAAAELAPLALRRLVVAPTPDGAGMLVALGQLLAGMADDG